jgi:hypothetical protein
MDDFYTPHPPLAFVPILNPSSSFYTLAKKTPTVPPQFISLTLLSQHQSQTYMDDLTMKVSHFIFRQQINYLNHLLRQKMQIIAKFQIFIPKNCLVKVYLNPYTTLLVD